MNAFNFSTPPFNGEFFLYKITENVGIVKSGCLFLCTEGCGWWNFMELYSRGISSWYRIQQHPFQLFFGRNSKFSDLNESEWPGRGETSSGKSSLENPEIWSVDRLQKNRFLKTTRFKMTTFMNIFTWKPRYLNCGPSPVSSGKWRDLKLQSIFLKTARNDDYIPFNVWMVTPLLV